MSKTWNKSVNRHAGATLRLAAMVVGNVCGLPDDDECNPEAQRVAALAAKDEHDALVAALEAQEAEVKYLRAWQTWKMARDAAWEDCGAGSATMSLPRWQDWCERNPRPAPPPGVEP